MEGTLSQQGTGLIFWVSALERLATISPASATHSQGPATSFPQAFPSTPRSDSDNQPGLGAPEFDKLHKFLFFFQINKH